MLNLKYVTKTKCFLFMLLMLSVISLKAQDIDSLTHAVATGTPEIQMQALDKMIDFYLAENLPKALEYAWKQKQIADKEKNRFYQGSALKNLASVYYARNMIDSALYFFETEAHIWHELNDTLRLADTWANIGYMQTLLNRMDEAIENNTKALAYFRQMGQKRKVAIALTNIANVYNHMDNMPKCEQYILQAIEIQEEIGDKTGMGLSYFNLCTIFASTGLYEKGSKYGEKAIELFRETDNPTYLGRTLLRICRFLLTVPDYREAAQNPKIPAYMKEAAAMVEKTDNEIMKYELLYNEAYFEFVTGNYKKAGSLAEDLLHATDTNSIIDMLSAYTLLLYCAIKTDNHEQAIQYFGKYDAMREQSSLQEWTSKMSEMEVKYDTEKKEHEIEQQRHVIVRQNLQRRFLLALGAVLLLLLATMFSLWRWTMQKKRVAEQQKQLAEQQVKQLEQEKQLVSTQAVLDGETRERARLARDLHDGLGSMLTGVKLNLALFKKGLKLEYADAEQFDKAMNLLDNSVREMRRVAHHLMPDSLSRFGLKPAVSDFCNSLSPSIIFEFFGDETRLDPKLEVVVYRCIHELVNNAMKYANATKIIVQIMQESDRIAFTVYDDGCGFDLPAVTQGTGLQNIRTRIASFGGQININSKTGEGTEINAELKI